MIIPTLLITKNSCVQRYT